MPDTDSAIDGMYSHTAMLRDLGIKVARIREDVARLVVLQTELQAAVTRLTSFLAAWEDNDDA